MDLYKGKSLDDRCPISGETYREVLKGMWEARHMTVLGSILTSDRRKQLVEELNAISKRLDAEGEQS